mmetsp:Transcript_11991/g.27996  ORF Transcript_11991/g.27996 Transcript_11991/m.27996 type:complete len:278 (+) Transcript_11991:93-926(+)
MTGPERENNDDASGSEGENSADEQAMDASVASEHGESDGDEAENTGDTPTTTIKKPKKIHRLSLTETEDFNKKLKRRGVIYVARVPPRMTPTKIKSLLSDFAEVTRVFLVEEDASVRKRRKKEYGSSGGKRYIEGWVEFASKRKAKHIAESLNLTPISNHKRNPHYGTLWNLKYLHKFKWSHLTEKVAYERRVREQKLRVEMMQARRENAAYVEMVETGKKLDKIEERKRKRGDDSVVISSSKDKKNGGEKRHKHHQRKPLKEGTKATKSAILGGLL